MANKKVDASKQKQIDDLVDSLLEEGVPLPEVQIVIPEHVQYRKMKSRGSRSSTDRRRLLATAVIFGIHKWHIGNVYLPDETKVDWNGLFCRTHWLEFSGSISHPDVDGILAEINDCMGLAVAAAIAAGALTGNLAAGAVAFKEALVACLIQKGVAWAEDIAVWIDSEEKRGGWHYCL